MIHIGITRVRASATILSVLCVAVSARAQTWQARHGMTPAAYQSTFNDLTSIGYRPVAVSGYTSGGAERYAAIFTKSAGGPWVAKHGMSATDYQSYFNYYTSLGYRLTWVNAHEAAGQERYAAIWEQKSGGTWIAKHGMSATAYQQAFDTYTRQGYRPIHIDVHTAGGAASYAAIFEKKSGPAWIAKHGMTSAAYQQAFEELAAQGYRARQVSGHNIGGTDYYAAIWEAGPGPAWSARHGVPESWYQNVFDNYFYQGYVPAYITAFASGGAARLNCVWTNVRFTAFDLDSIARKVKTYMDANGLPGLAIAITRDERLVYAAGFGQADSSTGEEAGPANLFRIASVSKPITSAAIMRLTHTHSLDLSRHVFGPDSILGARFPTPPGNERINKITVRHLLEHVSGFNNTPDDPMFQNTSYTHDQLIKWVVNSSNRFLTRDPGTLYEYSNFGFCVLGRVIEQISGMGYEEYVKTYVLNPSGATSMAIGANSPAARKPREVTYYPSSAYSLNVTRFDSHGGWVGSAIDLARFLSYADGMFYHPDIISAADRSTMLTAANILDQDGINPRYAFGWVNNGGDIPQGHNGAMPGTGSVLALFTNGYSVAAVANSRASSDTYSWGMRALGLDIINSIATWPAYDLF